MPDGWRSYICRPCGVTVAVDVNLKPPATNCQVCGEPMEPLGGQPKDDR